jgi:3-polyprenyl-4-hydroxybenzoate decarboxylase
MKPPRVLVGITGATGAIYAQRLIQALCARPGLQVLVTATDAGRRVVREELGVDLSLDDPHFRHWFETPSERADVPGDLPVSDIAFSPDLSPIGETTRGPGVSPIVDTTLDSGLMPVGDLDSGSHLLPEANPIPRLTLLPVTDIGAGPASGSYALDAVAIVPCSMRTLAAVAAGLADNLLTRAADVAIKERRRLVVAPREMPLSAIHLENMLRLARLGVRIVPPMPGFYRHPRTVEDLVGFVVERLIDQMGLGEKG